VLLVARVVLWVDDLDVAASLEVDAERREPLRDDRRPARSGSDGRCPARSPAGGLQHLSSSPSAYTTRFCASRARSNTGFIVMPVR